LGAGTVFLGTVVEGVAAFGVAVDGEDRSALWVPLDGLVAVFAEVDDAPTDAGARAVPIAIPAPRVVATPTLAQPTNRRLRDAGWGRDRRAMWGTVRIGGETGVKRR